MQIFALSDPHFGRQVDKPMDIFGAHWVDHTRRICSAWDAVVPPDALVLVPGDLSWAMKYPDALPDMAELDARPGQKLLTKGNHDFWWPNKKRDFFLPDLPTLHFLHGKTVRIGSLGIAATRGWVIPGDEWFSEADQKVYDKELRFLEEALIALGDASHRICMLHYPPFNSRLEPGEFVPLLEKYGVQHVVHGHLHGEGCARYTVTGLHRGIHYHLMSCDVIGFTPQRILDLPDLAV